MSAAPPEWMRLGSLLAAAVIVLLAGTARAELEGDDQIPGAMTGDQGEPENPEATHTIPVRVHILKGESGALAASEDEARGFVEGLAAAHVASGTPFVFVLDSIDTVTVPDADVALDMNSDSENRLLAMVDVQHRDVLNLFLIGMTCKTRVGGWAYPPGWARSAAFVVAGRGVKSQETVIHEVGHWLGLEHVHEGGCSDGDLVDDTPAQTGPPASSGDRCAPDYVPPPPLDCNSEADSCPDQPGSDSKSNYMSYWTGCRTSFTPGQVARMIRAFEKYKLGGSGKGDDGGPSMQPQAGCQVAGGADASLSGMAIVLASLLIRRKR